MERKHNPLSAALTVEMEAIARREMAKRGTDPKAPFALVAGIAGVLADPVLRKEAIENAKRNYPNGVTEEAMRRYIATGERP